MPALLKDMNVVSPVFVRVFVVCVCMYANLFLRCIWLCVSRVIAKSGLMAYGLMALWPYGLRFFITSSYNTTSLQSSRLHWVHASS